MKDTQSQLCPPERRKYISRVKGTLPVPGGKEIPYRQREGIQSPRGCINKPCYFLTNLLSLSPNFFILSIFHKFIVSLSKRYKSCLLWSLL